mgnify:FL=1|tara:strand:- start:2833 stop:5655 length:2823 start_codon:yes stop_codon:yes gene_type:complete
MLSLGALAFATPWTLIGLAALPAIWWLLRISPPLPKRVRFPAIRLLVGLDRDEETPAQTPLWLLLLRLVLAAVIVVALADPLWNPAPTIAGKGPLLIVADNGWATATHWRERSNAMDALIASAKRDDRPVLLLGTTPSATPPALDFAAADDAAALARALEPAPLAPDRLALLARLTADPQLNKGAQIVWLSDGIDYGTAKDFAAGLAKIAASAGLEIVEPKADTRALALMPPAVEGDGFMVSLVRAPDAAISGTVQATNAQGGVLGSAPFNFANGAALTSARIDLPLDLRNKVARIDIAGETSAGAVSLLDERWRRRTVGLVSGSPIEEGQPLLSDLYYLQRAIGPYAALEKSNGDQSGRSEIADLISRPLSVLILSDIGNLTVPDQVALLAWVEKGGVLVRFAGPKLAAQGQVLTSDQLMPVPLRMGGRELGGALSWTNPQHLAPFDADSPFSGLDVPADVTVTRQVLAEPTIDLGSHTWARLQDGTPLVTAAARDKGTVVLFHVTANSDWSSLPLSGLYVDMLRRVIAMSQGVTFNKATGGEDITLSPTRTLDGYGRLRSPPASATPVSSTKFDETLVSPRHPPGLYGPADSPRALNLIRPGLKLAPLGNLDNVRMRHVYAETTETKLRPPLLALALALIIADGIAALYVTGLFDTTPIRRRRRGFRTLPAVALIIGAGLLSHSPQARAANDVEKFALTAANETRIAYVLTGDNAVDNVSRAGLEGLSAVLRDRTSFEAADPMGVDVARDELTFFPLLYWPMTSGQEDLTPEALARINAYMEHGGTILFDTRDQDRNISGVTGSGTETLRRLIGKLDLPALTPVPATHVLTKSFYLLQNFPGRWAGGALWLENSGDTTTEPGGRSNDGVSRILIGSNDYAAAWARDASGRPMFPCEPGGEAQREMAFRFGVNLVMYTLTGNYKSDQVHIPALLERLGN